MSGVKNGFLNKKKWFWTFWGFGWDFIRYFHVGLLWDGLRYVDKACSGVCVLGNSLICSGLPLLVMVFRWSVITLCGIAQDICVIAWISFDLSPTKPNWPAHGTVVCCIATLPLCECMKIYIVPCFTLTLFSTVVSFWV